LYYNKESAIPVSFSYFFTPIFLFFSSSSIMASHLLRSSLRAIARPTLVRSFAASSVACRMPTVAFNATRSFSAALPRMSTGAGKCKSRLRSNIDYQFFVF
jgi:hypothetical protein